MRWYNFHQQTFLISAYPFSLLFYTAFSVSHALRLTFVSLFFPRHWYNIIFLFPSPSACIIQGTVSPISSWPSHIITNEVRAPLIVNEEYMYTTVSITTFNFSFPQTTSLRKFRPMLVFYQIFCRKKKETLRAPSEHEIVVSKMKRNKKTGIHNFIRRYIYLEAIFSRRKNLRQGRQRAAYLRAR